MIYRVVLDGNDILDYQDRDLILLAPTLELEVNMSGSLSAVMPPNHKYYDAADILLSTVEVYEDNEMIWFGRPIEQKIDFFKQKKLYCEGPLSFFNDTVQRPQKYDNSSLHSFFRDLINNHNGQIENPDRRFQVGNITVDEKTVYRKLNYETTYDALQKFCLDAEDGYLFFRREGGINYIDWLKEMPYTCNQTIQFGLNLLNYSSSFDATNYATCVIPLGKTNSETGLPLTIEQVYFGTDALQSDAINTYGYIAKVMNYSDIDDPYELMEEGKKYLENLQFNSLTIECTAADLHSLNPSVDLFRIGQTVHCVSNPHFIDRNFPLTKMTINLDSAAKLITLGDIKKKTLTRIYKQDSESGGGDITIMEGGIGSFIDDEGINWEIVMPDEPGGPVVGYPMPTHISVATGPYKDSYHAGESIDFTGLSVNIWHNDKIWTHGATYVDGKAPMNELSFSTKIAPNIATQTGVSLTFTVTITWKYKGQSYTTTLDLSIAESVSYNVSGRDIEFCHLKDHNYDRHYKTSTDSPALAGCAYISSYSVYNPIIVSKYQEGVSYYYKDGESIIHLSGAVEITVDGVTWYYQSTNGLYEGNGAEPLSHFGALIVANTAEEAARILIRSG